MRIFDIFPTPFTTRHDIAVAWEEPSGSPQPPNLYLAWTDSAGEVWLNSCLNATTFTREHPPIWGKTPISIATDAGTGPSIIVAGGMFVAYARTDGIIVVLRQQREARPPKAILDEKTSQRPSLAYSFQAHQMWLVWSDADAHVRSTFVTKGLNFPDENLKIYDETSDRSPGIFCDALGNVTLGWADTDAHRFVHAARVETDGTLSHKNRFSMFAGSRSGVSVAAHEKAGVTLGYAGEDTGSICLINDPFGRFDAEVDPDQQSELTPAIAAPVICWVADDGVIHIGRMR